MTTAPPTTPSTTQRATARTNSTITLQSRLRPCADALSRELDGELVFLQLETEAYFGLDPVATRMWQCLTEADSVAVAVGILEGEFDVDRAQLEQDVIELARDLVDRRLMVVEQHTEQPAE